jgi:dolichyl-phosphate-mannose--protein O-mannosyl transferase
MIAFGEWIIGPTYRYGWRFSVALVGTLSILMLARIARRMFGSTLLGCTAGLLLAVDGMHFTQSRTGLLDIFLMFWALAGFGFLLIDRDRSRARLAARLEAGDRPKWFLPWQWWRPFHLLAALCFGLSAGVKWSGAFFLAVFLVAGVLWETGARRAGGERRWLPSIVPSGVYGAITALPVAVAAYLSTWTGWFLSTGAWDRQWGANNPTGYGAGILPDALRGLLHYHHDIYQFHVGVTSTHPWQSNPWSWLVMGRPTLFWYEPNAPCPPGVAGECISAVHNLGTPSIWWGATLGVLVLLFCWIARRDWRAGAILAGIAAGYLPWFNYQERTIFTFYAIAFTPWVILTVVFCLGLILGKRDASPDRRLAGALVAGGYVVLSVAMFAWFYPVYDGSTVPLSVWQTRIWLPSWG